MAAQGPREIVSEHSEPVHAAPAAPRHAVLTWMFAAFAIQAMVLVALLLLPGAARALAEHLSLGLDYRDFYLAAEDCSKGIDPYLRGRLFSPPFSFLPGFLFQWATLQWAVRLFAVVNLALVVGSAHWLGRHFQLSRWNLYLLDGVVLLFYPLHFLVERGNTDGIVLALLSGFLIARRPVVRALLLGLSVAVKIYSALFVAVLLWRRQWKSALISMTTLVVVQLPFAWLLPSFAHAVLGRSGIWRADENLSPSVYFSLLFGGQPPWKMMYGAAWIAAALFVLVRTRVAAEEFDWTRFLPLMISFPALVYSYSAVVTLPLLVKIAANCQQRRATDAERLMVAGLLLLGFQEVPWFSCLSVLTPLAAITHLACPLGTLLLLAGVCRMREEDVPSAVLSAASAR